MAVTGQTYAQRVAAVGAVSSVVGAAYVRVNEDLITLTNFIASMITLGTLQSGNTMTSPDNAIAALKAKAASDSPNEAIIRAELQDGTLIGAFGTQFLSTATAGYVSASNVFNARIHFTTNQTQPAGIVAGQYWARPRV